MKLVFKRYTLPYRFISNFGSFVVITFGVFLGIELAKLLGSSDKNCTIENSPELKNVTNTLQEKVRILCFVFTREREHKAFHVQQTWGKHCNKLLFIATSRTEDVDSILLKVNEGPLRLWPKTLATLDYLYENHLNEADWFLKADADSFVIIENLRYFLYSYFPEQALYFSYHLEKHVLDPGYVLSRGALRRYGEMTRNNKLLCPISPGNEEEYEDALICFSALKIRMSGAVDPSKCVTSFPSTSCYSYETFINRKSKKFKVYMTESDCCPQQILSLSDVTPQTMHWLNYIIYQVRVHGLNKPVDQLPAERKLL